MCADKPTPIPYAIYQSHANDRAILLRALLLAAAIHLLFALIYLPDPRVPIPAPPPLHTPPTIRPTRLPPPPPIESSSTRERPSFEPVALIPVPETRTEPLGGEVAPAVLDLAAPDMPVVIGEVVPPAPSGPRIPGSGRVSYPVIVPESKVEPDYPELARRARLQGRVIVQAVIRADGSVTDPVVLQCTRPGVGFEQAAIDAIVRWRYEPALENGLPVDVYFTITVEFILN